MCRRNHMHGCCLLAFGLGLMIGNWLESWFLCGFGGFALMLLGLMITRQK